LPTLSKADALGTLVSKFLDPEIDLSSAGIDNHAMGTVFEEPVRKFNEENNEEAGEHWTPRDAVRLMACSARSRRASGDEEAVQSEKFPAENHTRCRWQCKFSGVPAGKSACQPGLSQPG
jgi:hypothetical protein